MLDGILGHFCSGLGFISNLNVVRLSMEEIGHEVDCIELLPKAIAISSKCVSP